MNDEAVCRTAPATPGLLNIPTYLPTSEGICLNPEFAGYGSKNELTRADAVFPPFLRSALGL